MIIPPDSEKDPNLYTPSASTSSLILPDELDFRHPETAHHDPAFRISPGRRFRARLPWRLVTALRRETTSTSLHGYRPICRSGIPCPATFRVPTIVSTFPTTASIDRLQHLLLFIYFTPSSRRPPLSCRHQNQTVGIVFFALPPRRPTKALSLRTPSSHPFFPDFSRRACMVETISPICADCAALPHRRTRLDDRASCGIESRSGQ